MKGIRQNSRNSHKLSSQMNLNSTLLAPMVSNTVGEDLEKNLTQNLQPKLSNMGVACHGLVMCYGKGCGRLHRVVGSMDASQYVEKLNKSLLGTLKDHRQ